MSQSEHAEWEAKFLLDQDERPLEALEPFLTSRGFELVEQPEIRQVDRYFDTPSWDLFRSGWAFRWRDAGPYTLLCLKSFGAVAGNVHRRDEVEQEVDVLPESMDAFPRGVVADRLGELLGEGMDPPRELFRLETHRRVYRVQKGSSVLLLCVDESAVFPSAREGATREAALRFHELELELEEGEGNALANVAKEIEQELAFLPARQSKFERGLQAVGLDPLTSMRSRASTAKASTPKGPYSVLLRRRLSEQFEALLRQEPRAWEGLDPEGVHQMRVASRRLRVALGELRELPKVPPKLVAKWRHEVQWICHCLGAIRDLDVHQEILATRAEGTGLPAYLEARRVEARVALREALASERYADFKRMFPSFLDGAFWRKTKKRSPTIRKAARKALLPALKAFRKQGRQVEKRMDARALHSLRIHGKHLRYLLEIFKPTFPSGLRVFVNETKRLQNQLGEHQDACVALDLIDAYETSIAGEDRALIDLKRDAIERRQNWRAAFPETWTRFRQAAKPSSLRDAM